MKKNTTDAGHGGNDSGAIGVSKAKESNIALDVAKKVDKYLKYCNINNNMTRKNDSTLSLAARVKSSDNFGSNTFVSIHCNSFSYKSAHGLEILYMSESGKKLAQTILDELKKDNLYNSLREGGKGIKYQNTHVCRETKAVACLIELGFITNQADFDLIMKNADKFSKAIARGICKYNGVPFVEKQPATGTESTAGNTFVNGDYKKRRAIVTADVLNVRYNRGTDYNVIGKLSKGAIVKLVYNLNGWVSIEGFKGHAGLGYVSNKYLKLE